MKLAFLVPDNRDEFRRYDDLDPYFGPAPTSLLSGLELMDDCEVHIVSAIQRPLRSPPQLARNIYYHSILVPKMGWLRGAYVGCITGIRRKLQELKPDLVHGQGTERYCALSAVYSGFPNLLTIHGNMRQIAKIAHARPFSFRWLAARLEAWALPRTDGVICLSTHTRAQIGSLAKTAWVLPNAVDASFFQVRRQPVHGKQILCLGHIWNVKNQVQLIRALEPLAGKVSFELVFLGRAEKGEPYADEFFRLVAERPWCVHKGFANKAEVQSALGSASLLVLPSLEENCPMAVLESMAAGLPVAASAVGGVPDLIKDGLDGLLFDPSDAGAIRGAVGKLLADDQMAADLAIAAKKKALQCFHPSMVAGKHMQIYRETVENAKMKTGLRTVPRSTKSL
jgi:glycosyltransferase involved in cell wall biosynthesis